MRLAHLKWLPILLLAVILVFVGDQFGKLTSFFNWLKDFQTLIAGLLAIGAAYVAYEAAMAQVHQREKELDVVANKERARRLKGLNAFLIVLREDVEVLLKDISDQRNCVGLFRLEPGMTNDEIERFFKGVTPRIGRSLALQWENSDLIDRPEILQRIERLNNALKQLDSTLVWSKGEILDINSSTASGDARDISDILSFYARTSEYCLSVLEDLEKSLSGLMEDVSRSQLTQSGLGILVSSLP